VMIMAIMMAGMIVCESHDADLVVRQVKELPRGNNLPIALIHGIVDACSHGL
jgi:hypothetical protein